jgi:uncharacterized delta-60 repeat protein
MNASYRSFMLAITIFFALSASISAAPGDLDPTFGNGGIVITTVDPLPPGFLGAIDVANGTAIQPDGKIVVVGVSYSYSSGQDRFAVVRYQPNGSLDTSFNGTGIVITPVNTQSGATSVALQADGKIVVAGFSNTSFAVVRYQPNGSLDTSFNGTGIVIPPVNYGSDARSVALQEDGKIVVVAGSGSNDSIIVRYNANGSLDTSFNGTGRIFAPFSTVTSAAIQTDGKIVVAGSSLNSASLNKFTISRYTGDGSPDTSFGGTGKVVIPGESPSTGRAYSVAIQPDGKIVAAGSTSLGLGVSNIVRCNPDGSLDTTFGGTGIVNLSGGVGGRSLALQPDGKIVAAGNIDGFFPFLFAVVRLNPNGSPDSTFGNGTGRVITLIGGYESSASSVAIQADGKIVVAGSVSDQFDFIYFAVVRYQGDAPSSSCSSPNPIDCPDFFVRQHYRDFLNREPDPAGLAFWTNEINACGFDAQCVEVKRINVSAAYFLSIEFQQTGYLVYRFYKSAFGNLPGAPVPVRLSDFLPDAQAIGQGVIVNQGNWQQQLETNKQNYANAFVQRARFVSAYPTSMSSEQFVDALFANAGVTPSASDRNAAINEFAFGATTNDPAARARALRRVAENGTLAQQDFNRAFVLMQYFGYLRRNPNDAPEPALDFQGYNFWLNKLDQFNGDFVQAEMVKAFITSREYRSRFGS